MILNEEQINYIAENLSFYGIKSEGLKEDLLDHICTEIENSSQTDFSIAYQKAIKKFGGYNSLERLQEKTFNSLHLKKTQNRRKLVYLFAFFVAFTMSTGALFKLFHWPFAGIILFTGFITMNFILLPLFFIDRYKRKIIN